MLTKGHYNEHNEIPYSYCIIFVIKGQKSYPSRFREPLLFEHQEKRRGFLKFRPSLLNDLNLYMERVIIELGKNVRWRYLEW